MSEEIIYMPCQLILLASRGGVHVYVRVLSARRNQHVACRRAVDMYVRGMLAWHVYSPAIAAT